MRQTACRLNEALNAPKNSISFWLCLAGLFFFVFLLWGKPVPYSNEFPYLLRLVKEANPDFLLNDWTFSVPANEHWLFNRLFSLLAKFLPIEILGWIGRIAAWILTLQILLRIGKLWQIPNWAIAAGIAFWLAIGQSLVGDEWIVGGFEAKSVSYIFLLYALYYFSLHRTVLPAALLGIAFAFHPAVGLWSALAVGLALLGEKTDFKTLVKIVAITAAFAIPGILPLAIGQLAANGGDSAESWRYLVTVRFPFHFDPFTFSRSATVFLVGMLVVNTAVFRRSVNFAMRFLLKFQIALAVFFLAGFILRFYEMFEWLRFLPVRLFPVFTPLFFALTVFYFLRQPKAKLLKVFVLLFVAAFIVRLNRIPITFQQIRNTYQSRTTAPDDLQRTSAWIAANTPNGVIVIQPPNRNDVWYFSRRAAVASFAYQTFGRLDEWRTRVADLTGNAEIIYSETTSQSVEAAFNNLSANQINEIRKKYAATYLVSRAAYSFPVVFQTETYKIYLLPPDQKRSL